MSVNPQTTAEIREARRMVAMLQEAAFAFTRTTHRITAWNGHAQALLGHSEEQVLTLEVEALLASQSPFERGDVGHGPVSRDLRRQDGSTVPARISLSPLGDAADAMIVAIVRPDEVPVRISQEGISHDRESLFRSVFEKAATGIALADLKGHFIECNETFQKMVGFKQRELRHLTFSALSHPQDRLMDSPPFRELLEGKRDYIEATKRLIHKDGSVLWIHETVSLVKDGAGQPLYCIALVNDITEDRREGQRAAIQLAMTKILAENPPANMAVVQVMQAICNTLDWQIGEYWTPEDGKNGLRRQISWQVPGFNATEFNLFGQNVAMNEGEGLPGTVWGSGSPAWFADVLRESNFLRRRMAEQAGIKGALAFPVRSPSGIRGVMVFAYRDFRQPDEGLLAMMTDFGLRLGEFIVRKQAERQLKLLGAIINSSGAAIVGTDLQGIITSWNPSAERLFGYSAEEALGKSCIGLFPQSHMGALSAALEQVREGGTVRRVEMLALDKHGASQEVWVTPSRITDEQGSTAGLSMTVYQATTR